LLQLRLRQRGRNKSKRRKRDSLLSSLRKRDSEELPKRQRRRLRREQHSVLRSKRSLSARESQRLLLLFKSYSILMERVELTQQLVLLVVSLVKSFWSSLSWRRTSTVLSPQNQPSQRNPTQAEALRREMRRRKKKRRLRKKRKKMPSHRELRLRERDPLSHRRWLLCSIQHSNHCLRKRDGLPNRIFRTSCITLLARKCLLTRSKWSLVTPT